MTKDREEHLKKLIELFSSRFEPKYRDGSEDHDENLWEKDDLLDEALMEVLDLFAYLGSEKMRRDSGLERNLQTWQFYRMYANTPLAKRFIPLDVMKHGLLTLHEIYEKIHRMDDDMRPTIIEQQRLLKIADWYFINHEKKV